MPTETNAPLWERVRVDAWDDLSPADAGQLLQMRLSLSDQKRAYRLGLLAQDGKLTATERRELEGLIHTAQILTIMKARARRVAGIAPVSARPKAARPGRSPARRRPQPS